MRDGDRNFTVTLNRCVIIFCMIKSALNNILQVIVKSVNPQKVILFGSRSRNKSRKDSDYDFVVVKEGVKNERHLSRRIYRELFKHHIKEAVDVIVVDAGHLRANATNSSFIYATALKEGKVLYG